MPTPQNSRRPDHRLLSTEESTTRYQVDARILSAMRAARQARIADSAEYLVREVLRELTETLRIYAGASADQAVLAELDQMGLTLDRVPRALLGQLIVSLAKRLAHPDDRYAFVKRSRLLVQARAA